MKAQKYLKMAIVGVICIVVFVVGYGIYINEASRRHIDKMEATRYTVFPVAYADYRTIHAVIPDVNITVRAPWGIDITAQYEGVLRSIYASPGRQVDEGAVLAVMENKDLLARIASAEADIEGTRARLLEAEQTASRYTYLASHNAISRQQMDSAIAQRDAFRAQLDSKIAQRDLVRSEESKMVIAAPQTATIVRVYREAGKYVRAGEALFMLADTRMLNGSSVMSHENLKKILATGTKFILEVQPHRLTNKAYPISSAAGDTNLKPNQFFMTIAGAVPGAQVEEEFHEVYWSVENPGGILEPTYYDDVKILSYDTARVLAVPTRAVHHDKKTGASFVYTLDEDSHLTRRDCLCGIEGSDLTEIVSGIGQGEPVVIADPTGYNPGMKVKASEYEF